MKNNSGRKGFCSFFILCRGASMLMVPVLMVLPLILVGSSVFGQETREAQQRREAREAKELLGTWVFSGAATTWTLQLNEDGSASLQGKAYSYTARGNRLVLVDDKGGVSSHTYFLSGDVLTVAPEGSQRAVKFTRFKSHDDGGKTEDHVGRTPRETAPESASRKSANEKGESADRSPSKNEEDTGLTGKWQSSEYALEIFKDGKLTINGEQFSYRVDGRHVVLSNNEGSIRVEFQLDRDTLTTNYQGLRTVYERVRGGSSSGGSSSTAGGAGESYGANPAELAGKWCYMSNVTASNGGRMSNTCFTLYPNGTYDYYSETSSSNPYGGTASQSSDGGTWSVSGATLIANSRSRGRVVYTLEKRNHPKTGDPMLMVDGDAFVTYSQRRPW